MCKREYLEYMVNRNSNFCDNGCPIEKPVHVRAHWRHYRDRLIPVRDYCRRKPRRRK